MSLAALFSWLITVSGGLYLLIIWLIEYDHEFQSGAATRLPVPVISTLLPRKKPFLPNMESRLGTPEEIRSVEAVCVKPIEVMGTTEIP